MGFVNIFNKPFRRFMVSYIILLAFTVLIGTITYAETLKMVKKDAIAEGLDSLERGKEIIDSRFTEAENLIAQLSFQNEIDVLYYSKDPLKTTEYYMMTEISSCISNLTLTNNFIDDLYIVYNMSDVIVSPRYASDKLRLPLFYEGFLKYEGMSFEKWHDSILGTYHYRSIWPSMKIKVRSFEYNKITYLQSIPLGRYSSYKGVVIVLIDEKKLYEYTTSLDIQNQGWMYIINEKGQLVSSLNLTDGISGMLELDLTADKGFIEKKINDVNYVIMYTKSSQLGWTYVAGLPSIVFDQQASYVKQLFLLTFFLEFLLGAVIAVIMSYRNIRPLRNIVNRIREEVEIASSQTSVDYDFIEGTVSSLIKNNKELQEEMKKQLPFIKASFFEKLLRGGFNRIKEIETALAHARLDLQGDRYIVSIIKIYDFTLEPGGEENADETEFIRLLAERALKQHLPGTYYLHNVDQDKIAIIYCLNQNDNLETFREDIKIVYENVIRYLQDTFDIQVIFGIGRDYPGLMEISHSFKEAERVLRYKNSFFAGKVVFFEDLPQREAGFYYPIELEMRLINLTKSGEEEEVKELIKSIYVRNFVNSNLTVKESNVLINEIMGTIEKIKSELVVEHEQELSEIDELALSLDYSDSIEDNFNLILKIFKVFCAHINYKKKIYKERLIKDILDYIHQNYMDENMGLSYISEKFGINEKYLSQFFKEETGENFSVYVEKLRLEQAVSLLNRSKLSVKNISVKVGYSNINTFYKAFKRQFGVSPSNYRRYCSKNLV